MNYIKLNCIRHADDRTKSPVVFAHGFPDSPEMFRDYFSSEEQQKSWLKGRAIYTISLPNRFDNPVYPPFKELAKGVIPDEFFCALNRVVEESPTGRLIPVVHDWGATLTWKWIHRGGKSAVERMVALSVGSSFRYDLFEHGLKAVTWLYGLWFSTGYNCPPLRRLLALSIQKFAGYRSSQAATLWKESYLYWDRPVLLLTFFPRLLIYRKPKLDFEFPVLYLRTRQDRIASTRAFEKAMREREDCRMRVFQEYNHWFPEQHSDAVLEEIRDFILV